MRSERAQRRMVLAAMVLAAVAANGCSGGKGLSNPFASASKTEARAGKACYAGVEGLAVQDSPKAGAKVVGKLALHQKLVRTKSDGGFAYVRAVKGGVEGWVPASKLLWKLPSAPGAAAKEEAAGEAAGEDTPAAEEATSKVEPAAEAAPAVPEPAQPAPQPKPVPKARTGASVFDPY